jgi:hypothetical protein
VNYSTGSLSELAVLPLLFDPPRGGSFFGAPGRAHLLGGESPLLARQGEALAERQGCSGRLEICRKPKAKRWPDEQEADTRRHGGVSRPISVKPETCTERRDVYPTGISVKVGASYPGRSARVPRGNLRATGIERCRDAHAEVSRGHSRRQHEPKGRTLKAASRRRDHTDSR